MNRLKKVAADGQDTTELINYTLKDGSVIKIVADYEENRLRALNSNGKQEFTIKQITNSNINKLEAKVLSRFKDEITDKRVVTTTYQNKAGNTITIADNTPAWQSFKSEQEQKTRQNTQQDSNQNNTEEQQTQQEDPSQTQVQTVRLSILFFESKQEEIDNLVNKYRDYVINSQQKYLLTADLIRRRKIMASSKISSSRLFRRVVEAASWLDVVKNNPDFKHEGVKNLATYYPTDNASNTAFIGKDSDSGIYYTVDSNGINISSFPSFREAENYLLGSNSAPIGDREVTQDGYDDGSVANSDVWNAYQFQVQQDQFQNNLQDESYRQDKGISDDYQYNEQSFPEYWNNNPAVTDPSEKDTDPIISLDLVVKVTKKTLDEIESDLKQLKNSGVVDEWRYVG